MSETQGRIDHLKRAADDTPNADVQLADDIRELESRLKDLQVELSGDRTVRSRQEPTPRSITQRVGRAVSAQWSSTSPPTRTNRDAYRIAGQQFADVLEQAAATQAHGGTYRPAWYSGRNWDRFETRSFASSINSSLANSVASSSTAPGSSSGSSGGGSSGGGGGGGGGSGW